MESRCRRDPLAGPAGRLAATQFLHERRGRPIHVEMIYADALLPLGDWFRQIWAESLGKGGKGATPVVARGATDQHSQLQLYVAGPDDKLYTLVLVDKLRAGRRITRRTESPVLHGRDLGEILRAEAQGTREALLEANRPLIELHLPRITPEIVGELLLMQQYQTALAGALYGVNPFDQPGVESGKQATLRLLKQPPKKPRHTLQRTSRQGGRRSGTLPLADRVALSEATPTSVPAKARSAKGSVPDLRPAYRYFRKSCGIIEFRRITS